MMCTTLAVLMALAWAVEGRAQDGVPAAEGVGAAEQGPPADPRLQTEARRPVEEELDGRAGPADEVPVAPAAAESRAPAAGPGTPPDASEGRLQVFVLDRGFYFSSDLGVFFTFGGVRGYSNVQPFMSVKAGFDVTDLVSVQLAIIGGFASENPVSSLEVQSPNSLQTRSYSLLSFGPEIVFAFRPTPRIALEPRVGGGITHVYPQISRDSQGGAYSNLLPHISFGLDAKYLTLLTNFTAGLSLTFEYILGPNVPALGAGFVVRYTL